MDGFAPPLGPPGPGDTGKGCHHETCLQQAAATRQGGSRELTALRSVGNPGTLQALPLFVLTDVLPSRAHLRRPRKLE